MSEAESQALRRLWRFADSTFKKDGFLYFVCSSKYKFKDGIGDKLNIEEDNLPSEFGDQKQQDFVYSYEHRGNHNILEIGSFLNTRLPAFINKENCEFCPSIETALLYNVSLDKKLELIDEHAPVFNKVINLFSLLKQSASYISEENSKFVFWINSTSVEGKSISRVVDFTFESEAIPHLIQDKTDFRLPSFDGPHAHDKAVLFKRALTESLVDCDTAYASTVMCRLNKIDRAFENEFSAYVNKFGLDKSLNELYDKLNDIIGKIFDAIQGTALKLLIVPGTMLATIFMRQRDASDWKIAFILIAVGALVYLLHFETKKYIDKISENGQQLLDSIININAHETQSDDIKKPQEEVKDKLDNSASETKLRITYYLYGSIAALGLWTIIIFWEKLSPYLNKACSIISNFTSV